MAQIIVFRCSKCGAMGEAPKDFDMYMRAVCKCGNVVKDSYEPVRQDMLRRRALDVAQWPRDYDWKGVSLAVTLQGEREKTWWQKLASYLAI